jgi:hypothetical protein
MHSSPRSKPEPNEASPRVDSKTDISCRCTSTPTRSRREGRCDATTGREGVDELALSIDTARRIACDATVQHVTERPDGSLIDLTRRSRTVRGRLRRAARMRDRGCRFPGCTRRGRIDVHHIIHWEDNGPTRLDNVVCLCRWHHRRVHEGGWTMRAVGSTLQFIAADGRVLAESPPPTPGDAEAVTAHGRSARDGKCNWLGEGLDLDTALIVLFQREELYASAAGGDSS